MQAIYTALNQIKKATEEGSIFKDQPMLLVLVAEAIQEVRTGKKEYEVPFKKLEDQSHISTFKKMLKQAKFKALCDLQELQFLLGRKVPDEKRILGIINTLLDANLYQNRVLKSISSFKPNIGQLNPDVLLLTVY
ncbi:MULTISPECIES: hypothetical protein [unclassified Peribacillus]|uniref:hypothetical protein n=1 Tax=unclassified Peribacillus TaxID=2675266 RepID=UPI001911F464|nr:MULTISPECIES: hypothetical protein [unclassified Peribacillus]MBK5444170.1 hypothetical protein [Peribacillus sp. TH24]WMX55648.1 hypothetical protein RE409_27170 [Peribacillus sp. R9-11]